MWPNPQVVVVIVSGFSAWPVLGPEFYLIDVQSVEAMAFVYSDCLGVGEKKTFFFFSLRIWSHLLKKSLMENFSFYAAYYESNLNIITHKQI